MERNLEIEEKIKSFFRDRVQIQQKSIDFLFSEDISIKLYCEAMLVEEPLYESVFYVIKHIVKDQDFKYCKTCGKKLNFSKVGNFCSSKCRNSNEDKIKEALRTYHNTLNVDPNRQEKVKVANKKRKKSCLEKYGKESNFQLDEFKEMSKNTLMQHFGVEYPAQCKEIREKQLNTYRKTMDEHHDEIVDKIKKTIEEKHGGYVWNKERADERFHQMWLNIQRYADYVIPLFEEKDLEHMLTKKTYRWKCAKCGAEFESHIHKTMHIKEFPNIPRCLNCYPYISGWSYGELELKKFVQKFFLTAHKDKTLIYPFELDIVIDELKLALEFNGCWFHNVEHMKEGSHLKKTLACEEKGYRLIYVWENDWVNRKDEVKSKLEKIFNGEENLDFTEDEIVLDRMWFSKLQNIPGYELLEEMKPKIIIKGKFEVENCGYLKYRKMKN